MQNKIIGINFLNSPLDQREMIRPFLYSKMPNFQSNGKHTYAWIYKNAHQSLRTFFYSLNYNIEYSNAKSIPNSEKVIVVLRDPIERWISGVTQYISGRMPSIVLNDDIIKIFIDHLVIDLHLETQTKFLHGIKFDQCVFFKLDKNLESNIKSYLEKEYDTKIDVILDHKNDYKTDIGKVYNKSRIQDFLNNNKIEFQNIRKALDIDYQLFDEVRKTVGFYNDAQL